MHKTRRKSFNKLANKAREREKTKTSLWNRQGNEEPIFPTKHWKNQHAKGNKNHPSKERLKTTWSTHAFQVQNKPKHTQENEMYISQF